MGAQPNLRIKDLGPGASRVDPWLAPVSEETLRTSIHRLSCAAH